jgi:hypothetical protein
MMDGLREFLEKPAGKALSVLFIIAALAAIFFSIRNATSNELAAFTQDQVYICSETLKEFKYTPKAGDSYPAKSPYTGKATGYPAEACFWTKDGQRKDRPTYVLVNAMHGVPGPTFCHDCGRLVVPHNPYPQPGMQPPPTKAEYKPGHNTAGD